MRYSNYLGRNQIIGKSVREGIYYLRRRHRAQSRRKRNAAREMSI